MRNVCLRSLSHPILYGTLLYEICQDNWDIQYVIVHTRRKKPTQVIGKDFLDIQ